jgi:hypothetical protein
MRLLLVLTKKFLVKIDFGMRINSADAQVNQTRRFVIRHRLFVFSFLRHLPKLFAF